MRHSRARPASGSRGERGAVTAELALGLPLLLALTVGLVWMLSLATAQVRVVDAAREAARAVARGDDQATARSLATRVAPPGARVTVSVSGDQVVVEAVAHVDGPGRWLAVLPGVDVHGRAVAVPEPG